MDQKPGNASSLQVVRILWGAFFATQFIHLFVLFSTAQAGEAPASAAEIRSLFFMLGPAAAFSLVLAIFLPPRIGRQVMSKRPNGPGSLASIPESELVQLVLSPFIVRIAFIESICTFGLVGAFMTREPRFIFPFLTVSIVAFLRTIPTRERLEALFGR